MQGIANLHRSGIPAKSDVFSCRGIGGSKETNNRGLADLLLFKKECLDFVIGRLPFIWGSRKGLGSVLLVSTWRTTAVTT